MTVGQPNNGKKQWKCRNRFNCAILKLEVNGDVKIHNRQLVLY